jgi:arsenate reductase
MKKRAVLFVCVHNSARSQMAEAFLNAMCPQEFTAESAGLEPGRLNPLAVATMHEVGIDISSNGTKSVSDILRTGRHFSYIITVCDETNAERCPVFPCEARRLHWGFPDPASLRGTWEERLVQTRRIRDAIRAHILTWCEEVCTAASRLA